jgi:hypothetical protein
MTITELIDYLLGRDATHDLALQLVSVHQVRTSRSSASSSASTSRPLTN